MSSKNNIPAIRFRGFDGEWEEKLLGDIGNTFTGLSGKTKDDFGHGDGRFITYMNVFSNPISDPKLIESVEIDNSQNEVCYGDVLFTTSSETPEEVGMSSVWLEKTSNVYLNSFCFGYRRKEDIAPYYMAYMLRSKLLRQKISFLAQGISRYNISKNRVMDISIFKPKYDEQQQIGNYFKNIDHLITQSTKRLEKLKNLKKAYLEKMFPRGGATTPELRFKGFSEEWEVTNLGLKGKTVSGVGFPEYEQGGKIGVPFYKVSDMNTTGNEREMKKSNNYVTNKQVEKMNWSIIKNIPSIIFAKVGAAVMLNRKRLVTAPFLIDNNTMAYMFDDSWDMCFGQVLFDTLYLPSLVQIGALPSYNGTDISNIDIAIPTSIVEQQKIGNFFRNIDEQIAKQTEKLDKLKNIKKACLDKMFV